MNFRKMKKQRDVENYVFRSVTIYNTHLIPYINNTNMATVRNAQVEATLRLLNVGRLLFLRGAVTLKWATFTKIILV
jgi:hypothetical protein